ncbi:MAG: hypothetical protein E7012_02245 [Alphaproteobacteria bacterium]|nr:hypothetical protein [Alphaproteobacteria bacterium]
MSLSDITNCHCPTCSDNLTKFKRDIPIKSEYDREKQRSHEMNKYVISVSILLLSSSSSLAQDSCMVRPSCADMGYTKSATDCEGKKAISCPFDLSAYYCPEVGESCDFSEYPLTECPTGGNCTEFECGDIAQFKLNSCQNNYEISTDGTTCNACDFSDYTLETCPSHGNCTEFECGGTIKYKFNSCKTGYYRSGNRCKACSSICIDDYYCADPVSYDDQCGCYTDCCDNNYTTTCDELCDSCGNLGCYIGTGMCVCIWC